MFYMFRKVIFPGQSTRATISFRVFLLTIVMAVKDILGTNKNLNGDNIVSQVEL